jgi:hypothetical protein
MSAFLSPLGGAGWQFFDNSGNVLTGGLLYTYEAGTTTPLATYTTSSATTFHTNPIVLDASGRVPGGEIWLKKATLYKFVVKTSAGVLIGTYDNLSAINGTSNFVSLADFGGVGDGVTNNNAAYAAAEASSANWIYVPDGTFLTTLNPTNLTKYYWGPGFTLLNGDYLPHRVSGFTYINGTPVIWSDVGNPALAMSGTFVGRAGEARQVYIAGANTAGTPTTGYAPVRVDLATSNYNLVFSSGHNQSTSTTEGRTGVPQYSSQVIHVGKGDVFNYCAGGYVNNPTRAESAPPLADLSLNCVIRFASPKPAIHSIIQPSWLCSATCD